MKNIDEAIKDCMKAVSGNWNLGAFTKLFKANNYTVIRMEDGPNPFILHYILHKDKLIYISSSQDDKLFEISKDSCPEFLSSGNYMFN